jgi:hypothetical protein
MERRGGGHYTVAEDRRVDGRPRAGAPGLELAGRLDLRGRGQHVLLDEPGDGVV